MAGCKKCGAGGGSKTVSATTAAANNMSTEMVLIEYTGKQTQRRRLRSHAFPREQYVFSGDERRFLAYRADVAWLTSMKSEFSVVNEPTVVVAENNLNDVPVLVSSMRVPDPTSVGDMPLDVLTLDPITLAMLKKQFKTVSELKVVGRSGWMVVKGIGATRANAIAEAINAL